MERRKKSRRGPTFENLRMSGRKVAQDAQAKKRGVSQAPARRKGKRGPKTERGKAKVRLNPVKHGVLSQTPVIPLVEREEDWIMLRDGTRKYFDVEGIVEEVAADQIAMQMWRRYRLVRFETESITRYLEEVPEDYERMRAAIGNPLSGQGPDPHAVEEMDRMLSARLLPGSEVMEKVMRYETRIHRFLLQQIHQLLVLQALRKKQSAPEPVLGGGKQTDIAGDDENLGRIRPSRSRALRPTETARGGLIGLPEATRGANQQTDKPANLGGGKNCGEEAEK